MIYHSGYGVHHTLTPVCAYVIWMLATDIPMYNSIKAGVMCRRHIRWSSKPRLSPNRRLHVGHLYPCLSLCSPQYHLFPDVLLLWAPHFLLLDNNLLAEDIFGLYEWHVFDCRYGSTSALLSCGVVRTPRRGTWAQTIPDTTCRPYCGKPHPDDSHSGPGFGHLSGIDTESVARYGLPFQRFLCPVSVLHQWTI